MKRFDWLHRIERLDPKTDHLEIYRISATHEFPWDYYQSLSFALFRTFAVPSVGGLLAGTGEFTARAQKRFKDTVLILDAVLEHGFASTAGRAAIRRMNQMHRAYPISTTTSCMCWPRSSVPTRLRHRPARHIPPPPPTDGSSHSG